MNISTNINISVLLSFIYAKNNSILKQLISKAVNCKEGDIETIANVVVDSCELFNNYSTVFKEVHSFIRSSSPSSNISNEELRSVPGYIEFVQLRKNLVESIISAKNMFEKETSDIAKKVVELNSLSGYNNSSSIH